MRDYTKSKIYKLIIRNSNLIYIGSTIQTLHKRLAEHKKNRNNKKYASYKLYDLEDDECKVKIILIKNFSCNNKQELLKEEDLFIQNIECINKYRAYLTNEEKKDLKNKNAKKWNVENTEKIKERKKTKIVCECGTELTKGELWRHKKSKKHNDLIVKLTI